MTKENSPGSTLYSIFYRCPKLIHGLSVMSSIGVLSSGMVVAKTQSPIEAVSVNTTTKSITEAGFDPTLIAALPKPTAPTSFPVPAVPVAKPAPAKAPSKPVAATKVTKPIAPRAPKAARKSVAPSVAIKVKKPIAPPARKSVPTKAIAVKPVQRRTQFSVPAKATVAKPPKVKLNPVALQPRVPKAAAKNSYIDRTNYNVGATKRYTPPSAVVLTERSRGCRTVARNGQLRGNCGVAPRRQPIAITGGRRNGRVTQLPRPRVIGTQTARYNPVRPVRFNSVQPVRFNRVKPVKSRPAKWVPRGISVARRNRSVRKLPTALAYYNLTQRPSGLANFRQSSFVFPVTIPSAISSLFGWRIHPISGNRRFHAGTDIAAPLGTPVVAAADGEVVTADFLGGYGLTVMVRHEEGTQESRYAHLSEIFVQPGEWVQKGTVIGRVGSTGNSTGPHLHFEWRHATPQGWVAVDAGSHLKYSLGQLVQALQVAQNTSFSLRGF
ncbi:M23 family metallopeptidase [Moorena bouillonii]|uniref:M23ase beta-sheet core domain-containing protein n=1 Tax=Moorena bouillonii PNG TaxID=568701 RepID=A0A1U7N916_9CYAN|nr:M23 family metallopeptidase [Moorena bouillonii]OLT62431.1 hypothetical protein BJP37_28800 [Moorena bouillonii PNG]